MFHQFKSSIQKIYTTFATAIDTLCQSKRVDSAILQRLENLLITSDVGVKTTNTIMQTLQKKVTDGTITDGSDLYSNLSDILHNTLQYCQSPNINNADVCLLVGINGSGKTSLAGKLSHRAAQQGKKVLLIAADTFRAAAQEQLSFWAQKTNANIVVGKPGQDPASVVFFGCRQFAKGEHNFLLIDSAGRIHTKVNLMYELEKIRRVISRQLPNQSLHTIVTIDATLGQSSFAQAHLFKKASNATSAVLTKMDGTSKGGIVFALVKELNLPISYITFGEKIDQISQFDPQLYITGILNRIN